MTIAPGYNRSSLKLLLACCLASGLIFFATKGSPVCFLPVGLFAAAGLLRAVAKRNHPDQDILLGFLILSFFVDDISQVAWGRTVDTWTEAAGSILFKSYGITGMEAFAILATLWIAVTQLPRSLRQWAKLGLLQLLLLSSLVFLASFAAGLKGVMSGGDVNTLFIQLRFLHCLPLWAFIGFTIWRDREFSARALKWITIMVTLKSFQALFVYYTHYAQYTQREEYLVDHYFSGFSVIALIGIGFALWRDRSMKNAGLCLVSMGAVGAAYIFNDRRTSYVGVALATGVLPFLLPWHLIRKHLFRASLALGALVLFTMITWHLPKPLGFIGETYRSFGNETGIEEPSYRDLENANLMHAIAVDPLSGKGYGKQFDELFPMPDISFVYERYRMIPHNLFLASWAFGGPATIAALSLLFAAMVAGSGKLLKKAHEPQLFLLGITSLYYALQYFSYTFGDLGFQIQRNQMMAGLLLGACFRIHGEMSRELKGKAEQWC